MSEDFIYPGREYWAFMSPANEILPSTVRHKLGESEGMLYRTFAHKYEEKYWHGYFTAVRVKFDLAETMNWADTQYLVSSGYKVLEQQKGTKGKRK